MDLLRSRSARVLGGLLLALSLAGCEGPGPVAAPGPTDVYTELSLADKQRVAQLPEPGSPAVSNSLLYLTEPIPYQPIEGTLANEGPVCDDCVRNDVPIGFDFEFYGTTHRTLQISSNGFLRFAPANDDPGCCTGRLLPQDDGWNNLIAFAWQDIVATGGENGVFRYETRGTAPNRRFILHADHVRFLVGGSGPSLNQWVILYEGSNAIEIHTDFLAQTIWPLTQGIENADGTDAAFANGRVLSRFSLSRDAVRFTPLQVTSVELADVYSGLPARESGVIERGDQHVFVEILDVERHLGRRASADEVRIGPSFERGTPAEAFEILDLDGDGRRDIRVRFSLPRLVDAGHLVTQMVVWGRGPAGGHVFRAPAHVQIGAIAPGGLLHDNGAFVTHLGQGADGAHASVSEPRPNPQHFGANVQQQGGDLHYSIVDDFAVPIGGWDVGTILTYAYQVGGVPAWQSASLRIRSGSPSGPLVATLTTTDWEWTGVYRVTAGGLLNTDRPIYALAFRSESLHLTAGRYYLDWQVEGGESAWSPVVTAPDPDGGVFTRTVFGNGHQRTEDGLEPIFGLTGAETPFHVFRRGSTPPPVRGGVPRLDAPAAPLGPGHGRQATDRAGG